MKASTVAHKTLVAETCINRGKVCKCVHLHREIVSGDMVSAPVTATHVDDSWLYHDFSTILRTAGPTVSHHTSALFQDQHLLFLVLGGRQIVTCLLPPCIWG